MSCLQIIGRWCIQHGFVYLTKTEQSSRMASNGDIFNFTLSAEEMSRLDALTTSDNLAAFRKGYIVGTVRDTPLQGKFDISQLVMSMD